MTEEVAMVQQPEEVNAGLWASALASHTPFLLARARALVVERTNAVLLGLGLNSRSFSVLWLASEGLRPSQRELSDFLDLDPSQVVTLIDELEARGAVLRQLDPSDRRARQIVATPEGRRLHRKALGLVEETNDAFFEVLPSADQDELRRLLRILNQPG